MHTNESVEVYTLWCELVNARTASQIFEIIAGVSKLHNETDFSCVG